MLAGHQLDEGYACLGFSPGTKTKDSPKDSPTDSVTLTAPANEPKKMTLPNAPVCEPKQTTDGMMGLPGVVGPFATTV